MVLSSDGVVIRCEMRTCQEQSERYLHGNCVQRGACSCLVLPLAFVDVLPTMRNWPEKCEQFNGLQGIRLERAKGFEPSTPTLARLCSTPELRPRSGSEARS